MSKTFRRTKKRKHKNVSQEPSLYHRPSEDMEATRTRIKDFEKEILVFFSDKARIGKFNNYRAWRKRHVNRPYRRYMDRAVMREIQTGKPALCWSPSKSPAANGWYD